MTINQKRYNAGFYAAKNWLQQNEGNFAGMIPDSVIMAVATAVINADEAERLKEATPAHPANTAPVHSQ